ncbi:MAG: hypothetical protein NC328_00220 [Muribaculum sp.]|nr:hypothetical protein [Muribaculum sp.]
MTLNSHNLYYHGFLLFLTLLCASLAGGCHKSKSESNSNPFVCGNWQIVGKSPDYSQTDSLLFIINPSKATSHGSAFNGIYTSSYVENDSLRAVLIYDSISGFRIMMHRLVAVHVNPTELHMIARLDGDTASHRFRLVLEPYNSTVYTVDERSSLDSLVSTGKKILFIASTPGGVNNPDAQVYTFFINAAGFLQARQECNIFYKHRPASLQPDTTPNLEEDLFGAW